MCKEVIELMQPQTHCTYIDGTLGLGGHTKKLLEEVPEIEIIGFDRDLNSINAAKENLAEFTKSLKFINQRFSRMTEELQHLSLSYPIKGILLDLGVSTPQMRSSDYDLSFCKDNINKPLNMQLDPWCKTNAQEILNTWKKKDLQELFEQTADYIYAKPLSKLIVENRPINTIGDFVSICNKIKSFRTKIHPATIPMMSLRIAVNEEFEEIQEGINKILDFMEPGVKLLVISFHSGEDRIVKNIFRDRKEELTILTKKPLVPSREEIRLNPASRSAKLRAVQKL
jgi:16S rRNA (cytosine1402-N4)-methyltransferase